VKRFSVTWRSGLTSVGGFTSQSSLFGGFGEEVGGHGWGALHVSDSQVSLFTLEVVNLYFKTCAQFTSKWCFHF